MTDRPALLDVNVLVALFDPNHVHHEIAHSWFAGNRARGWATCPLTEDAFLRIVSNPSSGRTLDRPAMAATYLRAFRASGGHQFWPAALSLLDETTFDLSYVSHRQLTDVYLLGLAHKNGGTLATFDPTVPVKAVVDAAEDELEVIGDRA